MSILVEAIIIKIESTFPAAKMLPVFLEGFHIEKNCNKIVSSNVTVLLSKTLLSFSFKLLLKSRLPIVSCWHCFSFCPAPEHEDPDLYQPVFVRRVCRVFISQ